MGAWWSWPSAITGATSTAVVAVLIFGWPRDPTFEIASISLSSFKFNIPLLDIELTLTVHITNPNLVPVLYDPATVSIYYAGTHLGSAQVEAGSQSAMSCRILHLLARLDSLKMAHHVRSLLADVARREMELYATVDIPGVACLLGWRHKFIIHVESHVFVDPVLLQVIDQENHSQAEVECCGGVVSRSKIQQNNSRGGQLPESTGDWSSGWRSNMTVSGWTGRIDDCWTTPTGRSSLNLGA